MTSIGLVVQARMGSKRLPGKVLRPIGDLPLLGHIIGRLSKLAQPWEVVVATTTDPLDDAIVAWCMQSNVATFRGSEHDVLKRYLECAQASKFQHVVRLTADNPFTDICELERLVRLHLTGGFDYTHSFGMLPVGVGSEIITLSALERSDMEGLEPHHREHVNEYIQEHPDLFRIGVLDIPVNKREPGLRLTVDTEADLLRADSLARQAKGKWLETREAIALCSYSV